MLRKEKENKNTYDENKGEAKVKFASFIILVIMIFSIAGFAMLGGGGGSSSSNSNTEIPFRQFQTESGSIFWGAILNSEQFIFENIDGFEGKLEEKNIAEKIKNQKQITIFTDTNFSSLESLFIIKKGLTGLKISFQEISQFECNPNTLIFTTKNTNDYSNCIVISSNNLEAYNKTNIVLYHLIQ